MRTDFYDKVHACWLGKNIGGTLGGPYEGWASKLNIKFFNDFEEGKPLPNDDLDLQLVNLHAMEQHGIRLNVCDISEEWKEHVFFPYDEYGYALLNLRRGIRAPLSGSFDNAFINCMGSPIRSELWAAIAAGKPKLAAYYAFQDATVDHAGGEGVYGEVFFTVLECLAYENSNILEIINEALSYIPKDCKTASVLTDTLNWHKSGISYDDIRDKILEKYGNENFTDAPQNIAFTVVGLLYGENFEYVLLKAVNMGYDTDCTAATAASIYGILYGTAGIPEKWSRPVGENITISPEVKGLDYPKTIDELTERTVKLHKALENETGENWFNPASKGLDWQFIPVFGGGTQGGEIDLFVRGQDGPLIIAGKEKKVDVALLNRTSGNWNITVELEGGNTEPIAVALESGKGIDLELTLPKMHTHCQVAVNKLIVKRIHDGNLWSEFEIPFVLPCASRWLRNGEEIFCDNGTLPLEKIGNNTIETTLFVPTDRKMQIVGACPEEYTLFVDGNEVIKCENKEPCLPAFHRAPKSHVVILDLKKGVHTIKSEVKVSKLGMVFGLLPVAPKQISEPGNHYYHIDCEIGL